MIETEITRGLEARLRPLAFRRALANLVDNGVAHADRVKVTATARQTGGVEIAVDDDGPGDPRGQRTRRPSSRSSRLDESRNQNEKGVGLGLAIARDMARGLGGDLVLSRSAMGGLRALIRLPG
ncbi:ATP-binding protein [Caulobacter segnis]